MEPSTITPEERAVRRAARKLRKKHRDRVREKFLRLMPKGGLCVEIGVWRGDFSQSILEWVKPDKLVLIDPWEEREDTDAEALTSLAKPGKVEAIYERILSKFDNEIAEGRVEVMREFSTTAIPRLEDRSVSFAYVDGDHSYEGVTRDLDLLFSKLHHDGVMAFDDYHFQGWWGDGVVRAIHEFLGRHPSDLRVLVIAGSQIAIQRKIDR